MLYPPPKSLDDPEVEIALREHLEQQRNQG
jgi:hypothetical protein